MRECCLATGERGLRLGASRRGKTAVNREERREEAPRILVDRELPWRKAVRSSLDPPWFDGRPAGLVNTQAACTRSPLPERVAEAIAQSRIKAAGLPPLGPGIYRVNAPTQRGTESMPKPEERHGSYCHDCHYCHYCQRCRENRASELGRTSSGLGTSPPVVRAPRSGPPEALARA